MMYTVETTHYGWYRIEFSDPYVFTVHRQFLEDDGVSTAVQLDPSNRAAVVAWLSGLSDDQLATFAGGIVQRMAELQAQIGGYTTSTTTPVFQVHAPESSGFKLLTGEWPSNPYVVDLRFAGDGLDVTFSTIDAGAQTLLDRYIGNLGTENTAFFMASLLTTALELAAAI